MENINLPNEYILLYQVNHNKDLCKKAAAFAKRKGMKLIRVTNDMSEIFGERALHIFLLQHSSFI